MANIQYFLTYHAIERFQERFSDIAKEETKVKQWKRPQNVNIVKDFFDKLINESQENRAYLNNTNHMIHLYETYGYDTEYKFMENMKHGILFVIAKERNENHFRLVTLMPTEYRKKFALNTIKYNGKEKKEDKKQKQILQIYSQYKQNTYSFENEGLSIIERLTDLEKQVNFENNYKTYLSQFLLETTKLEQEKNEKILNFCSKNYNYSFVKKEGFIDILEIKKLTTSQAKKRVEHFELIKNLELSMSDAILKEQLGKNLSLRSIVLNDFRYEFKYYEKFNTIEIINKLPLKSEELLSYAIKNDLKCEIKERINQNKFTIIEKKDSRNMIGQTQIVDKRFYFNYCETNSQIEVLKVEYLLPPDMDISYELLTEKLIKSCGNSNSEILEKISATKKLRKTVIGNKEIKFIHSLKQKEVEILEIKTIESKNNVNYLEEQIDFNKEYLEQFKGLTDSLSQEEEMFLKQVACVENVIKTVNKRKSIHKVKYKNIFFEYLINKTKTEGYLLTLLKKEA